MKIEYINKRFRLASLDLITTANVIIEEYSRQGFTLTLRQLYYQFVARGLLPNKQSEYKRLGSVINDGRLAGRIDWFSIEDRTRFLRGNTHWESPAQIIKSCVAQYKTDKWSRQDCRVEVWIEKDALIGVIAGVCDELDIDYFACRGYVSQSEAWRAGRRYLRYWKENKQRTIVIHLGDHDPSGIDMSRDIGARFDTFFVGSHVEVKRVALNMNQVEEFSPPPNPAKLTDSRARGYIANYGNKSWELDALEPAYIAELIKSTVEPYRDPDAWEQALADEYEQRAELQRIADSAE